MKISMTSSSSCSSNIQIKSGPIDGDVLWMQAKHVSEHIWNGEEDRKLHIRRAVPTYQGQEEIPEEIIPLLRQYDFYWIMKMRYLKINATLISALIERWRPETHSFHMRCGECTITLQDVSVLLGLRVDGSPLIGPTNLDWADLCEELLGVRPQEGELQGDVLFVDKGSSKVFLRYLQFLRDFRECSTHAWGPSVLAYLYREMCSTTDYKTKSIGVMCILIQMWAWERRTSLAPKRTPPVIENKPLGHRWLRRGNQHIGNDDLLVFRSKLDIMKRHEFLWEPYTTNVMLVLPPICLVGRCPSQPLNIHGITLKGKQYENWGQLFAPMISQWNNRANFRVDSYPKQEGLLSFNSDYVVWNRRKTKMFVDPKNANTTTLAEVTETLQYMVSPQGRNTWTVDDLVPYSKSESLSLCHMIQQQSINFQLNSFIFSTQADEGRLSKRKNIPNKWRSVAMECITHHQHFCQYPTQMYQYPFEGHHTDTSASEHSFGGIAKTHPNFSWPTMTPSQQHGALIPTPNAPLGTQWNVPGAIPDMGDLLGVGLRYQFSAEADQLEAGRHLGRRNPDRQARRWDRPCGTSSRHHRHHNP
ncbi:Serine/threonine-protein phosphatase 7 long form [Glycine soja]